MSESVVSTLRCFLKAAVKCSVLLLYNFVSLTVCNSSMRLHVRVLVKWCVLENRFVYVQHVKRVGF